MKNTTISDLYERAEKTLELKREETYFYDDDGRLVNYGFPSAEVFEFLIFIDIRNSNGDIRLQYPVAIGHEPILDETMRGQLAVYSNMLPHSSVAVVAIENSLTTFGEWDLFGQYATAEELIKAKLGKTDAVKLDNENYQPASCGQLKEQTIEAIRFNADDSEPLPIVISARRANSGKFRLPTPTRRGSFSLQKEVI